VSVEQSDFEHWSGDGRRFPLVFSAQAWHWVSPEVGYPHARALLEQGGWLAVFWNRADWERTELRESLREAYRRAWPDASDEDPMNPSSSMRAQGWMGWEQEIAGHQGFGDPEVRTYRWQRSYPTADYVDLLRTHSPLLVLDPEPRAALLAAVAETIDAFGDGRLTMSYATRLCLARAR
jgi:hypothetical protein